MTRCDVLVVGGGPAGLAAAIELRRLGVQRVLALEREEHAGGIPRHSAHTGFGLRDLHRLLDGPRYAARYVQLASDAGVELRTGTTVTAFSGATAATTSADGLDQIEARAVILATGCRERPRAARLVPGTRPLGVFTTGALQQFVYLQRQKVGRRAVVVGAEHVSFSAVLTLAHAGATTAAMTTELARHQTYAPFKWISASRLGVPILTSTRLTRIFGAGRVAGVEVTDLRSGDAREIGCDTVVFSGDWIADHDLSRRAGLAMDPAGSGPYVDCALRTSQRGVFAAGNLLHGAETADVAALSGRHAARAVDEFLRTEHWPESGVALQCAAPLRWVSPSALSVTGERPPHGHFILRVAEICGASRLVVRQGQRELARQHYRKLIPNLPIHLNASWTNQLDPGGPPVALSLEGGAPSPSG